MQIIGSIKCRETKKCRLWFDQRGKKYHFVDLNQRALSVRELEAICRGQQPDQLIDKKSKAWKKRQLEWKEYEPLEELLQDPLLLLTPVVREGLSVIIGSNPEAWEKMINAKV